MVIYYADDSKSGCLSPSSARRICLMDSHNKIACPKANSASLTATKPTLWYHAMMTMMTGYSPSRYRSHGTETLGTHEMAESMKTAACSFSPFKPKVWVGIQACLTRAITSGNVVRNGRRIREWRPWKRPTMSRSSSGQFGRSGGQKVSDTASTTMGTKETMRKPKYMTTVKVLRRRLAFL